MFLSSDALETLKSPVDTVRANAAASGRSFFIGWLATAVTVAAGDAIAHPLSEGLCELRGGVLDPAHLARRDAQLCADGPVAQALVPRLLHRFGQPLIPAAPVRLFCAHFYAQYQL